MKHVVFVKDKHTGGHYAIKNQKSKNAFKNPMKSCHLVKLLPDDVVVDVGAYVGEYSMYAARFAKRVIAYEPSQLAFGVLSKNCHKKKNVEVVNAAVVGDDSEFVDLHVASGVGVTNSIVKAKGKVEVERVKAIRYEEAIKDATVVKVDVEGAEYGYNILQPHLRAIILEFHPIVGRDWESEAQGVMDEIQGAGFTGLLIPKFSNGWDTNSAWVKL